MGTQSRYSSLWERIVANSYVDEESGCWFWKGKHSIGRPALTLRVSGRPSPINVKVARLVLEELTGYEFPFDHVGHYRCFNPACIAPHHIRIETVAENLSTRRGYKPCKGPWIPTLYPTPSRLANEAAARAWLGVGSEIAAPGEAPPF